MHSWNPHPHLKGGDQLFKIGNLGGDKITLSKKAGEMKKGGLVYTRGGSVFLLVLQIKSVNLAIIQYIPDLDCLMYYLGMFALSPNFLLFL